jgi:hypothetical protein
MDLGVQMSNDAYANSGTNYICTYDICTIYTHTYAHTYKHTHIHIYTYTHIHIYTFTHIHIYTYTHIHIYTYTHIHIYTYTHIHIYTGVNMRMRLVRGAKIVSDTYVETGFHSDLSRITRWVLKYFYYYNTVF